METKAASTTAVMMCAYRARASAGPAPLIHDPWAKLLAGEEGERITRELDPIYPAMELWTAVRTAYIDEHVRRSTSAPEEIRQVMLLGAGLDTRAARLARPGVRFFEIDQPGSQADKRRRIEAIEGYPLDAATF